MPKTNNIVWRFFSSVKLALISLIVLAVTSILGTLIKQRQDPAYYIQEFGAGLASFFETVQLTNMYTSWWFIGLLCLFAVNLVVCSIERLPAVWRQMRADNLDVAERQLQNTGFTHHVESRLSIEAAADRLPGLLAGSGWTGFRQREQGGAAKGQESILLSAQKGTWTRLGVYIVHLSILVILAGAIIGLLFGFQAYVFIPEGKATGNVFLRETKQPYPLDFKLRCDRFEKSFYPNGMIKQYHADLTVLDPERSTPYRKSIIVNDPLTYRGLSFYLGDSYPMEAYLVVVRNQEAGQEQAFRIPAGQDVAWQGAGVSFQIEELKTDQDGAVEQARISFNTDDPAEPAVFWMLDNSTANINTDRGVFTLSFRQLQSALFLVTKDPGLWIVYAGFIIMIVGLAISFFLSHRKIWVLIEKAGKQGCRILISGSANKHRPAFAKHFEKLVSQIDADKDLIAGKQRK